MTSGALASIIGTPFDVSLVRMQADGMKPAAERRGYTNVFNALMRISREEGVPNLWRGFEPTAFRAVAMNVGMMASFDQTKQLFRKVRAPAGRGRRVGPPRRHDRPLARLRVALTHLARAREPYPSPHPAPNHPAAQRR